MSLAIKFENVGKAYRLGQTGTGTFCHDLNRWFQTNILRREDPYSVIGTPNSKSNDIVWALDDINCEISPGELVAIIGRNGAGKSTMLKLLSRITAPTTGRIKIKGRLSSLLEVGTGFHPELTGRENIYFNGSLMGLKRKEIQRRFDEIVDFAEISDYVDTPVKRYSSGMWVRLGFAIAAHLDPDILVVDEVLAVGDVSFQRKAIGCMKKGMTEQGRTVLFVSHNMGIVKSLCQRGIVLDKGRRVCDSPIDDAINYYMGLAKIDKGNRLIDAVNFCQNGIKVHSISFNNQEERSLNLRKNEHLLDIVIKGKSSRQIKCAIKMIIMTLDRQPLASFVEGRVKGKLQIIEPGEFAIEHHICLPKYLAQGDYLIDLSLHEPCRQDFFRAPECCVIHCEGNCDLDARPMELKTEGMYCLEEAL